MRRLTIIICCVFFSFLTQAQDSEKQFPNDFFGTYTGMLSITSERGDQKVPMEFHLLPSDSIGTYTYTLVYGEGDAKQVRNYALRAENAAKGEYIVDENNGIILDDKVIGNRMFSLFEVNDTLLTTFITFEEDQMIFEIVASPKSRKRTSHPTEDPAMEVISYPITTVQRAVLKKQ